MHALDAAHQRAAMLGPDRQVIYCEIGARLYDETDERFGTRRVKAKPIGAASRSSRNRVMPSASSLA